jgi:hypothetical protein
MSFFKRLKARLEPILLSDAAFIEKAYRDILGREPDAEGVAFYRRVLREGVSRTAVLVSLMKSDEYTSKLPRKLRVIAGLRALRPDRYRDTVDRSNDYPIAVFEAASPDDFDWLEAAILEHGYYEKPGVWNLEVDTDKRVIAEIVASFAPSRALELGCAAGAVLEGLQDLGVEAEGLDISAMAIARASARVRDRIHQGDLLSIELPSAYDMVFGLDVFEHLNPNRLDAYVHRIAEITRDGGFLFCNIPAFGEDPVFGTLFPFYVDGWEQDAAAGRPFSTLHVDDDGYPIHGHLVWADARWWVRRFEAAGFRRLPQLEHALHKKYDAYMVRKSPARRAYFVFGKNVPADRATAVVRRVESTRSAVLDSSG